MKTTFSFSVNADVHSGNDRGKCVVLPGRDCGSAMDVGGPSGWLGGGGCCGVPGCDPEDCGEACCCCCCCCPAPLSEAPGPGIGGRWK